RPFRRWFARRRGECDPGCCCDGGCCDAGGGEGCACHGCHGCDGCGGGEHHHAACDGCVVCGDCCVLPCSESSKSRKSNQTTLNSDSTLVGMVGRAAAPLSPTGVVLVADKRVPAKSQGGEWIGAGEAVIVSGVDTFGVLVRPHLPEKPAKNVE
ncbi:MAG: NfeD family protein, partial [Pirellulaceae bacterium]|nr:NfeD family protein [Pirellulaceae bacterium]